MAQPVDSSFDNWGFSVAGFVTDFILAAVCLVLGLMSMSRRRQASSDFSRDAFTALIMAFASLGVPFLFGGLAHMYIGILAGTGRPLGKTWAADNSGWMYLWLAAAATTPAAALLHFNVFLTGAGRLGWLGPLSIMAAVLGVMEIGIMFDETLLDSYSGLLTSLMYMASSLVCSIGAPILAAQGRAGMSALLGASGFTLLGWVIAVSAPSGCRRYSDPDRSCPYPAEFNQNAIFHVLLIVAEIMTFFAGAGFEEPPKAEPMADAPEAESVHLRTMEA